MKLEQQACSVELAKHLKELGVKQESYWYWMQNRFPDESLSGWKLLERGGDKGSVLEYSTKEHGPYAYSAFTVAELLELCPKYTEIKKCWASGKEPEHFYLVHNVEIRWEGNPWFEQADTAADAVAKFLIYLLENHLLT